MNTTPHLNRSKVKQTALEIAGANTGTRIHPRRWQFLERIEAKTMQAIREEIRLHPSRGKNFIVIRKVHTLNHGENETQIKKNN